MGGRILNKAPTARWKHAYGLEAAVICTLQEVGREAEEPAMWTDAQGSPWEAKDDATMDDDFSEMTTQLTADNRKHHWREAATLWANKDWRKGQT